MVIDFRQNKPLLVGGGGVHWQGSYSNQIHWHRDEELLLLSEDIIDRKYGNPEIKFYKDAVFNTEDLPNYIDMDISPNLEKAYRTYVYNIEVEDYHTYYVGKAGIWVHNTNNCQ